MVTEIANPDQATQVMRIHQASRSPYQTKTDTEQAFQHRS